MVIVVVDSIAGTLRNASVRVGAAKNIYGQKDEKSLEEGGILVEINC